MKETGKNPVELKIIHPIEIQSSPESGKDVGLSSSC